MKKVIYIESSGCLARSLDAQRFYNYFKTNGCKITRNPKKADYILFIACAAIKDEEEHSKMRILKLKQYRGELIIGGCISSINRQWCNEHIPGKTFSTQNLNDISSFFRDIKISLDEIPDVNKGYRRNLSHCFIQNFIDVKRWKVTYIGRLKHYFDYRLRRNYYIRIGYGCINEHCSYCAVWKAIGHYKSKPLNLCLKEFKDALSKRYRRIHLVADNLGPYGLDIGETLPNLLKEIIKIKGKYGIHLEEFNLAWIVSYLNELIPILKSGKIKSIFCPIQSGSNRILNLMNRRYFAEEAKNALLKIKDIFPDMKYYTDIIIGFPTETDADFESTLKMIKEIGFTSVSYYPYDDKAGTIATTFFPKISDAVIKIRIAKLEKFLRLNRIGGGMF